MLIDVTTIPKVYQVQAHRIQILHESEEPIEELQIPTLPRKLEQNTLSFDTSLARPLHQLSAPSDPPPKRPATRELLTNERNSQRLGSGFESITKRASYAHVPLLLCLFLCTNDIAFMSFCHVKGSGQI